MKTILSDLLNSARYSATATEHAASIVASTLGMVTLRMPSQQPCHPIAELCFSVGFECSYCILLCSIFQSKKSRLLRLTRDVPKYFLGSWTHDCAMCTGLVVKTLQLTGVQVFHRKMNLNLFSSASYTHRILENYFEALFFKLRYKCISQAVRCF